MNVPWERASERSWITNARVSHLCFNSEIFCFSLVWFGCILNHSICMRWEVLYVGISTKNLWKSLKSSYIRKDQGGTERQIWVRRWNPRNLSDIDGQRGQGIPEKSLFCWELKLEDQGTWDQHAFPHSGQVCLVKAFVTQKTSLSRLLIQSQEYRRVQG